MMDNYDESRIKNDNISENNVLHQIDHVDFINFGEFQHNKNNYNFGAEILNTNITPDNIEETEIKTNCENNTEYSEEEFSFTEMPIGDMSSYNEKRNIDCNSEESNKDDNDNCQDSNDSFQSDEVNELNARETDENLPVVDSDESTSDSDFTDFSGLSDISGQDWKPISSRPINWVQKQMHSGVNPRDLLSQILPSGSAHIEAGVNDMMLWRLLASMVTEPPRREKLRYVNSFQDVVDLVLKSTNIIVLTGAGVSVSCGIPDFRSSDGIYSRLAKDFPDLPDPQAMFDINYFSRDPRPFYKFAREIYPGQFKPSPCHHFIKLLEQKNKLLRNYTQNIDTLEQVAGIRNVIECHGSFSTASCTKCKFKCNADAIREDIFVQRIPVCVRCQPNVQQSVDASERVSEDDLRRLVQNGIMKPDIVFFGEGLPEEFHTVMASDKDKCDLLIVMGSSLKVRPVALIPSSIPANVPQILINREQLHHLDFDVELLGDSDVIINQLCHRLGEGWKEICYNDEILTESTELQANNTFINSEEITQQNDVNDADTQSVKSNASTDIALQSTGAYSDSGFESSTSSACIAGITKRTIGSVENFIPRDLLHEEPMDPFVERLQFTKTTDRQLSIDSSKDSDILCDSSNSRTTTITTTNDLSINSLNCVGDSGGGGGGDDSDGCSNDNNISSCTKQNICPSISSAADVAADVSSTSKNCNHDENCEENVQSTSTITTKSNNQKTQMIGPQMKRRTQKRPSASERLIEGTYYRHESTTSYVFPGAQVFWHSDSDEDSDLNDDEDDENCFGEGDDDCTDVNGKFDDEYDGNTLPLSPLLPPALEAEVVNEIASTVSVRPNLTVTQVTTSITTGCKRRSNEYIENTFGKTTSSSSSTMASSSSSCTLTSLDSSTYDKDSIENFEVTTTAKSSDIIISSTSLMSDSPPVKRPRSALDDAEAILKTTGTAVNMG